MSSSWPRIPISVAAQGSSAANVSRYRSATASTAVGGLAKAGGREGVALVGVTGLIAGREPLLPLRRRAVSPLFRVDPAGGLLLDAVVAHRRRGRQRVSNVLVAQRFEERHAGALLFGDRGVVRPHSRVAVGLQFGADACAFRPRGILLRAPEDALQVLHMVAVFMSHHVLLSQRAAAGTEL